MRRWNYIAGGKKKRAKSKVNEVEEKIVKKKVVGKKKSQKAINQ